MIRVVFVDHSRAMGGAEHSLLVMLKHLDRTRFEPILACSAGPLAEAAMACGVRVHPVAMPRLRGEPSAVWRLARGVTALSQLILEARADAVHCNVLRASFYAALAAQRTRRPLIWHVRDILRPGLYTHWMAWRAAKVMAVSRAAAAALPAWAPLEIVPNGVELAVFARQPTRGAAVRREWGVRDRAPLVGMVGRLERWKGQHEFVRAMAIVQRQRPDAFYAVVGGSIFGGGEDYRRELEALRRALGLGERLVFSGHRDDMPAVLSALDVLVHCSIEPEPFGRVMIEAMAASLPVVAYGHGAASEIIVPGETGTLVAPHDVQALATAVLALLADGELAQRYGQNGRRRAEQQYDVCAVTRRVEALLEDTVAGWHR